MTELMIPEDLNATDLETFSKGSNDIIEKIRVIVSGMPRDIDNKTVQDIQRSTAAKIAKVKNRVEAVGKSINDDANRQIKLVNDARKFAWNALEDLQKDARKELSEFEAAEAARKARHEQAIKELQDVVSVTSITFTADALRNRLKEINTDYPDDHDWQEYAAQAAAVRLAATTTIESVLAGRIKWDQEQAELEEFRAQKAQKEIDDAAVTQKERDDAAAKAAIDRKTEADKAEQDRLAKDRAHKSKILGAATDGLVAELKIDRDTAKAIIKLIANGKIPNVKIIY